ncbi:MAG: hypothetical protein FRX48_03110 [Lasallia pustulata]|uniref:Uncharacterized protein n=1 Tax=Lasallia pustulata TaxID=136370 RepID=A0A5M8PWD1_9LECA|nr:MAG: hypothetical protein FRX48_03110 [Lasallia pustulata]
MWYNAEVVYIVSSISNLLPTAALLPLSSTAKGLLSADASPVSSQPQLSLLMRATLSAKSLPTQRHQLVLQPPSPARKHNLILSSSPLPTPFPIPRSSFLPPRCPPI